MLASFALAALSAASLVAGATLKTTPFDPYAYKLSKASCAALDRTSGTTKKIDIEYVSVGPVNANKTLLFVHGWPSIWTVWGPQVQEFSKEYRVIAPNLRGFGGSGFPGKVKDDGTFFDIAADLNCVLEKEKVSKATCVGIDWGSQMCMETARFYPDKIVGASGTIPYQPAVGEYTPVWTVAQILPSIGYQVYFTNYTDKAVAELNTDIRRSLRSTYRGATNPPPEGFLVSQTDYLGAWGSDPIERTDAVMSQREEDYMVEKFKIQGFKSNLYLYQNENRVLSHEYTKAHGGPTVNQPVLFVAPDTDPVIPDFDAVMKFLDAYQYVPNYKTVTVGPSAHWVTLEAAQSYNNVLREWLDNVVYA
ncbi:alpha/beta-hydrolase [Exidia glandulosa HHB12029]|uniref:Alpha/beta-hydrolase n=1 Tax=Exidia glandulosa HHB12029 TaxID=1314781 RepID=A0A165BXE7_EXIGL|nr:alpha/beta-hydrolase [Exidia glandulosa HHB12029]